MWEDVFYSPCADSLSLSPSQDLGPQFTGPMKAKAKPAHETQSNSSGVSGQTAWTLSCMQSQHLLLSLASGFLCTNLAHVSENANENYCRVFFQEADDTLSTQWS